MNGDASIGSRDAMLEAAMGEASADGGPSDAAHVEDASSVMCPSGQYAVPVIDYFTGDRIATATGTVDGAAAPGFPCLSLGTGVHPLEVSAAGYATYRNAIQVPGGATRRVVTLVPLTPSITGWLSLVNSDRMANGGAPPLQLDSSLMIAAWDHAVDMGVQGYFAHWDPHGFSPQTRSLMLGSMIVSAENIAANYATYTLAEQAFMAEKAKLPNQSPSDCATSYDLAGHYCDLITTSHNLLGVALAQVPGSPYGTYYDQEFGDLYAYYDTTVIGPQPAAGTTASITLVPAAGFSFNYEFIESMPAPTPIPVATLNADPTCATECPTGDPQYPSGNTSVSTSGVMPYSPTLSPNQIVFLDLQTNETTFFGSSALAAFWAGGTPPTTYGASSLTYRLP
jgi:hypothetical protein